MRLPTSALALAAAAGLGISLHAAAPSEIWPDRFLSADKEGTKAKIDLVNGTAGTLPVEVAPALEFQRVFLRVISGAAPSEWREAMDKMANEVGRQPVEAGVAELARVWLARAEMADIDAVLHAYYKRNVRFPEKFVEIEPGLPEKLRTDPWGEAWAYEPAAPHGFDQLKAQRYRLWPSRHPGLTALGESLHRDSIRMPAWTVTLRDLGGNKALEFRFPDAASVATLQPGGRVGDCTLLFIGNGWALMAGVDQLFTLTF